MRSRNNRLSKHKSLRLRTTKSVIAKWFMLSTIIGLVTVISVYVAFASISLSTSVPYVQSFDGMGIPPNNFTPSILPVDFRVDTLAAVRT